MRMSVGEKRIYEMGCAILTAADDGGCYCSRPWLHIDNPDAPVVRLTLEHDPDCEAAPSTQMLYHRKRRKRLHGRVM